MALAPAIYRPTTPEAFFILLTFTSPVSATTVFRVVNNNEDVVSRGNTFTAYPFSINLPSDIEGEARRASITIDNVSREITRYVRQSLEPPTVKIELVLSSTPNTVEKTIDFLRMVEVSYDAMTVTATLEPFDIMNSPAIEDIYAGDQFPDLVYE